MVSLNVDENEKTISIRSPLQLLSYPYRLHLLCPCSIQIFTSPRKELMGISGYAKQGLKIPINLMLTKLVILQNIDHDHLMVTAF